MTDTRTDRDRIIRELQLEPHVEGGYFRRTYQASQRVGIGRGDERPAMSAIYYMLTADSPVGRWHRNRSDIVHFYHMGDPLHYYLIHPDGSLETAILGPDICAGQRLQLTVTGGTWKATHLPTGDYGLVSEAVSPGFDYADMTLGIREELLRQFPRHADVIEAFTPAPDTSR